MAKIVKLSTRRQKANPKYPGLKDPAAQELCKRIEAKETSIAEICRRSGVSRSCVRAWLTGKTQRPQGITMDFVARAMGYHRPWQPISAASALRRGSGRI